MNNLPADVMRSLGAATVLAVDVGADSDTDYFNYGEEVGDGGRGASQCVWLLISLLRVNRR